MKKKSSITTQPDWRAIVLSLFMQYILLDSADQVYGGLSGILKDVRIVFVLVLIIFSLVAGRHYTLCDTGLVIRLFGIPIRKYKWSDVNSIIFLHTWKDKETLPDTHTFGIIKGNAFMISLNGCPPFHPEYDSRINFSIKHPLTSIFFTVTPWKKDSYIEFIRKRYPEIRIQPSESY